MSARQFLTAVFELRPTRHKAAALERVRAAAETVFWSVIDSCRERADVISAISDEKARLAAWRTAKADIDRGVLAATVRAGIAEPIGQGLARDVAMAVSSYIELCAGGHEANWPALKSEVATDHDAALALLVSASTQDQEKAARDALLMADRPPRPRPLTIARARDTRMIRQTPGGGIAVLLNVLRATDPAARPATIQSGIDATTGEVLKAGTSKTRLIIPVACSKWHEQKFLSGHAILKSSLIRRVADRWFLCAQFEFPVTPLRQTGVRLGIDRGVVNPIAMAVVEHNGAVRAVVPPAGQEIGRIIRQAEARRKKEAKRRGVTSHKHRNALDDQLHVLANGIVAEAKQHGARVVVEKLDGLKSAIRTKRGNGERKRGWRKVLKNMQLAKLETILDYKLRLAGLPSAREVVAGGTSSTCPACGLRDQKNRPEQARFACVHCGFTAHADTVASVNIARRGVAMAKITKGAKLAPIEEDMVARLRSRGDSGLGPLAAGLRAASGFVAARVPAGDSTAYDGAEAEGQRPLTVAAGQNGYPKVMQNARKRVLAERRDAFSKAENGQTVRHDQGFAD